MTAQQTILLIPISLTAFVFKNQYNVNGSLYWNDFYSNGIYTWSHTMEHLAIRADLNYTCKIICMFVNCWKLKYDIWFIFIKMIYKAMWYIWSHHATLCSSSRPPCNWGLLELQGVPWCVTMYISHYCRNHFNIIFAFSTVHMIYLKLQHNVFCAPYLSSFFSLYTLQFE
jgi:hypothetical protein